MPTVLRVGRFRFFFFSNEGGEDLIADTVRRVCAARKLPSLPENLVFVFEPVPLGEKDIGELKEIISQAVLRFSATRESISSRPRNRQPRCPWHLLPASC